MDEPKQIWKVFFPQHCLSAPSGICLGWTCTERQLICIVGIAHTTTTDISCYLPHLHDLSERTLQFVGLWSNKTFEPLFQDGEEDSNPGFGCTSCITKLVLHQHNDDGVPTCTLYTSDENTKSRTTQSTLFILYDEKQLIASKPGFKMPTTPMLSSDMDSHRKNQLDQKNVVEITETQRTDIEEVFYLVQRSVETLKKLKSESKIRMSCDMLMEEKKSWMWHAGSLFSHICCLPLRALFAVLLLLFDNRLFQNRLMQLLVHFPSTGCQLIERFGSLQAVLWPDKRNTQACDSKNRHESKEQQICVRQRRGNIVCSIAVDICLGVLLMLWLQHNSLPARLADWIMIWTNTTGDQLQRLLHWLMGNPAGLKLNSALAHFLGHFFLYHVYLWMGYLTVIGPFLSMLIWCMALSGCLGLSVLLSVASDMLAILTFHIYCFYVYAAKIFNLQMSSLLSLSRLFRGKKWNVLRHRVDSCSYDIDQLFMGTLLFTMLLFLLPTTALFYTVFTLLRLILLIIQSLLSKLVHQLNSLPVYSIMLWLIKSDTLTDGIEFHVNTQVDDRPPYLIMQVQSISLSKVIQIGRESFYETSNAKQQTAKGSSLELGKNLLLGHLIYPWGERKNISK